MGLAYFFLIKSNDVWLLSVVIRPFSFKYWYGWIKTYHFVIFYLLHHLCFVFILSPIDLSFMLLKLLFKTGFPKINNIYFKMILIHLQIVCCFVYNERTLTVYSQFLLPIAYALFSCFLLIHMLYLPSTLFFCFICFLS